MTLRFLTAGESHGPALTVILEGIPAGLPVDEECISRELQRRQAGFGAGGRMKIEHDRARILSGVMAGVTTGAPISLLIEIRIIPNGRAEPWTLSPLPVPGMPT